MSNANSFAGFQGLMGWLRVKGGAVFWFEYRMKRTARMK